MAGRFILTFALLFAAWIAFTGTIIEQELIIGMLASLIVTIIVFRNFIKGKARSKINPIRWVFFIAFLINLLFREITAHLKLIAIILSPRLKIKPEIVEVETNLENEGGTTALANSVTLTPGTLTLDTKENSLEIHCITKTPEKKIFGRSARLLRGVVK